MSAVKGRGEEMEEMSAMWEEKKLGRDHGARISLQRTKAALGPWRATARDSLLLAVLVYVLANMAFKGYTHLTASPSVGVIRAASIDSCPGYAVSNVVQSRGSITADLSLAGPACNVYGTDLDQLKLLVEYQTDSRIHVKIYDAAGQVYQVPTTVLSAPTGAGSQPLENQLIEFLYVSNPFSFSIRRIENQEIIFNSNGSSLVFESQYLRLRTSLPDNPNLYGLGESTDPFRLPTTDYIRTIYSRDSFGIPRGTNLYGNHPVYFENRSSSNRTHGVFLLNSNGMDIMINSTGKGGQYLEYNTIGGVIDLYFLAGPGPIDVASQYSEVVGKPAMMPYWGFGFHQCRYGYNDYTEVAEVIYNYSLAGIPLETMWTDIDYMDGRKVFTLDPERFPLERMRELVAYLHDHDQHYIVMVDPAVAYQDYGPFNRGVDDGVFLKTADGSIYRGVTWPGVTAFPDWFHPNTQSYWNNEFDIFFNADTGLDIDGLWIDMNEATNFCVWPCTDPYQQAIVNPSAPPPLQTTLESLPGAPADFPPNSAAVRKRQTSPPKSGLPGRNLIRPPYSIHNAQGSLSARTISTDIIHANGIAEYDTHSLYGTMMSSTSRDAMLSRRPALRPLVITRSTFAGAGAKVGHWTGDNFAYWSHYLYSIAEMIEFAALYQIPMVGSDVCGFVGDTTETLCARWAMLGAFYPFYRNHNADDAASQEFYRWPLVAAAAQKAIKARYQLLDYIYTAMHTQSTTGAPLLNPVWFLYPTDPNALAIDLQYFYGDALLVSPVTAQDATSVTIYLPDDIFYDFWTYGPVRGAGANVTLTNVSFTDIPVHIRGGTIVPLRANGANTTAQLRLENFVLLIAPGLDGMAVGRLYIDDGVSLVQDATTEVVFAYDAKAGMLRMRGSHGHDAGVTISSLVVMGAAAGGQTGAASVVDVQLGLEADWEISLA